MKVNIVMTVFYVLIFLMMIYTLFKVSFHDHAFIFIISWMISLGCLFAIGVIWNDTIIAKYLNE